MEFKSSRRKDITIKNSNGHETASSGFGWMWRRALQRRSEISFTFSLWSSSISVGNKGLIRSHHQTVLLEKKTFRSINAESSWWRDYNKQIGYGIGSAYCGKTQGGDPSDAILQPPVVANESPWYDALCTQDAHKKIHANYAQFICASALPFPCLVGIYWLGHTSDLLFAVFLCCCFLAFGSMYIGVTIVNRLYAPDVVCIAFPSLSLFLLPFQLFQLLYSLPLSLLLFSFSPSFSSPSFHLSVSVSSLSTSLVLSHSFLSP